MCAIKGIWSLRKASSAEFHHYLVQVRQVRQLLSRHLNWFNSSTSRTCRQLLSNTYLCSCMCVQSFSNETRIMAVEGEQQES